MATGVAATPVQVEVESIFLNENRPQNRNLQPQTTHTHQLERRPGDKLPGNHVIHKPCVI